MSRSSARVRGRWPALTLVAVLASVLVLGAAPPSAAHDQLTGTSPSDGESVSRVPDAVELRFNQPVLQLGAAVRVTGPGGEAAVGDPQLLGEVVRQDLRAAPAGTYQVSWRVTGSDGHPLTGEFTFTAEESGSGSSAETAPPGTDRPAPGRRVSRWLLVAVALAVTGLGTAGLTRLRGRRR